MRKSIQILLREDTAVIFEDDEFLDMSELKSLLQLQAYQDSNSDVKIIIWIA